jgi:subtilisin family serine protease
MSFFRDFHLIKKLLRLAAAAVFLLFFFSIQDLSVAGTSCPISLAQRLSTYVNGTTISLLHAGDTSEDDVYRVSFLNDRAREITGAAALNVPGFVVPDGLTGAGQIVALADSGLDAGRLDDIHPDLQSIPGQMPKVVLLKSWAGRDIPDDPDGHGTHMAATIAGTGKASNGQFRGVAPGASLYFQAILNKDGVSERPALLEDLFWPAYSAGARVHVDGWGDGLNTYLEPAAQVDDFVRNHPDFLVVFGAGNSGPSPGTITTEANSKNALAVGASILPRPAFLPGADDTAMPTNFSSRGPSGDGRIKPELLAPASAVISARSRLVEGNLQGYPDYTRMQGTSMAAAVAGGDAALLREYLKEHENMSVPSAALIKAIMINGSRSLAGPYSKESFGIIDLAGTVVALKDSSFKLADEWAGVSQGAELTYTFHVTDAKAPFKATLAWTDPAAEPGGAQTLVNDLDLIVQTPDSKVYYGNHFLGKNTADKTNNVEQVCLTSPVPGDYKVRIVGSNVSRNTVSGSDIALQDFALAWGQPPAEDMIEKVNGKSVTLESGASFNVAGVPAVNLIDDNIVPVDAGHLFPGEAVFQTPKQTYFTARLWRSTGIRALKTVEGNILTEINPAARLGGYTLAQDGIILNNTFTSLENIPTGVEVSAVVNPLDQKIRQVRAIYTEREGVVSNIRQEKGQKILTLAGGKGSFRIAPEAAYSYEDSYVNTDKADTPFGTGALEELDQALPGMPVLLHLAPSSGEIQYLAVKRRVALGTVHETSTVTGEIKLENGASFKLMPGAPVKRDKQFSSIEKVQPGDLVTAVILPDTGEAIGLVVFSSVHYGKAIDFTKKNRMIYFLDEKGQYRSLYLPPEAIIYRWGVRTTADAIAAGSRIRVTTDPAGKEVWQLDIAETLFDQDALKLLDPVAGIVATGEGRQYSISNNTSFFKNGYPVQPEDFQQGEQVELEYVTAPPPTGNVLVAVRASSTALPPPLLYSTVPLQDRLVLTGRADADTTVYIWEGDARRSVPVDASGRFFLTLYPLGEEYKYTLVAFYRRTGGVTGRQVSLAGPGRRVNCEAYILDAISGLAAEPNLAERPLTRAEAAAVLARLLNWPDSSEWSLSFTDEGDIPAPYRPAVAEARARGIINGYPDGSFRPLDALTRADAAVIFAAVLRNLGLEVKPRETLFYQDTSALPPWTASAVAEADTAGLFRDRQGGMFAPGDLITAAEMVTILNRFLEYCETIYNL